MEPAISPEESDGPPNEALDGSWWSAVPDFSDEQTLRGSHLYMGLLGNASDVIRYVAAEPQRGDDIRWSGLRIAGPRGGVVAVLNGLADGYDLELVTIDGANRTPLLSRPKAGLGVAMDEEGRQIYVAESAPGSNALDVVAIDARTGEERLVSTLPAAFEGDWQIDLGVADGGSILVVLACSSVCTLTAVDVTDGRLLWSRPSDFTEIDGAQAELLTRPCGTPCLAQVIDPVTGIGSPTGYVCETAVSANRLDTINVVTDSDGTTCPADAPSPRLATYQVGEDSPASEIPIGAGFALVPQSRDSGFEIHPGWVLLVRGTGMAELVDDPTAVVLADTSSGRLMAP